jgi:serine/threonine-protein kinase
LDALAYAHARGVIHRDIKPANIMVTGRADGRDGAVKLMDFGIARMKADRQLTQTGSAVGSLYYMSPEQINGGAPDPRSDIYSVGITMYEMVTGRRPFLGESDFSIMSAHLQQAPVAPIEIIPGVPPVVNDLILMAIEKDPAARFQSAEAFRAALASAFPQAVASAVATKTLKAIPVPAAVTPPSVFTQTAPPPVAQFAPPPIPQMSAPPMPAPPAAKSRRGLYMALGSLATILVLIAAVVEGPKLLHGGAADAQSGAANVVAPSPTAGPAPVAASPAESTPAPVEATPPPAVATSVPQGAPASPAQPFRRIVPQAAQPVTLAQAQAPAPAVQAPPAAIPPAATPPAATPPAATPQPPTAATASPEMKELRDRINRISVRAAAAQSGVRSIEQAQERQGFGLRGDIKAATIRLDLLLQEARTSLQNGDVDGARRNLQYAEGTLSTVEKFLGF